MEKKIAFFLGVWKGKGFVLGKNIEFLEQTTFKLLRSEPAIVISC